MHFSYWMILVAASLPYVMSVAAKSGAGIENARPRVGLQGLQGWRQRANWAQLNHFEAFPAFAAAVLVAELAHAPQHWIDILAGLFVVMRVGYGAAYIGDGAALRSSFWFGGILCVIALFFIGI